MSFMPRARACWIAAAMRMFVAEGLQPHKRKQPLRSKSGVGMRTPYV